MNTDKKLTAILSLQGYKDYIFVGTAQDCFDDDGDCTVEELPYNDVTDASYYLFDDDRELKKELRISKQDFIYHCNIERTHSNLLTSSSTTFAYDPVRDVYVLSDDEDMHYYFTNV